jgi:hypothetical protein
MNVLLRERARILWNQQRIVLDPGSGPTTSRLAFEAEGYRAVPFKITANRQIDVEGTIGSHRYQFCLDTGSSRTTLEQAVVDVERLPSKPTMSVVRSPMKEFGDSNVRAAIPAKFQLGEFNLSNHKVDSAALHLTIRNKGEVWAGLIGVDLLQEYDAIIDLASNVLYLRNKLWRPTQTPRVP